MELSRKLKAGIATAAVAGLVVAGAVIPATAQDESATEETQEERTDEEGPRAGRAEAFAAALAEELAIEQERVEEALADVREQLHAEARERRLAALEERLAEAVEDGDLTQEQADAVLAAAEEEVFPLAGRGHGPRFRHFEGPAPHRTPDDDQDEDA